MERDEVKQIVDDAVTLTLARLGITSDEFLEVKKDLAHMRSWRLASEKAKDVSIKVAFGILITGIIGWMILGFKDTFLNQ